jgi:hypothetical protein
MITLYHATSHSVAAAIESGGFLDADFYGIAHGVFLSDRPLDAADDVARYCDVVFEVDVPANFELEQFEAVEEDRPEEAYREWLIPASILNSWVRRRFIEPDDSE